MKNWEGVLFFFPLLRPGRQWEEMGGYNQAGIKLAVLNLSWASDSQKGLVRMWIVMCGLTPGFQVSNPGWWLRTCISRKSPDHLDAARWVPHLRWVLNSWGAQELPIEGGIYQTVLYCSFSDMEIQLNMQKSLVKAMIFWNCEPKYTLFPSRSLCHCV